jgi:hypothetical protein
MLCVKSDLYHCLLDLYHLHQGFSCENQQDCNFPCAFPITNIIDPWNMTCAATPLLVLKILVFTKQRIFDQMIGSRS